MVSTINSLILITFKPMNRPIHFEIQVDDLQRAAQFYRDLFDWKIEQWPGMDYWMVMTAPQDSTEPGINGGMLKRPCPAPAPQQGTNAFVCTVGVDNIDAVIEKGLSLGAKIAMPKFDIGGMAWQAYLIDTEGNTFGLHQQIKK